MAWDHDEKFYGCVNRQVLREFGKLETRLVKGSLRILLLSYTSWDRIHSTQILGKVISPSRVPLLIYTKKIRNYEKKGNGKYILIKEMILLYYIRMFKVL